MPNRENNRHRGANQRPMNHRLAGGLHRPKNEGCLSAAIAILSIPALVLGLAIYAIGQAVQALN